MEIRMVKCPRCQTVYNAAMNMGCPQCSGAVSRGTGFSKTEMPGASAPRQVSQTTGPINSYAGSSSFSRTAPPVFSASPQPHSEEPVGTFSKTQPPQDGRFVHTQYWGETATTKAEMRVTGWIVQIDGPNAGKEYRIHTGYNYIGRENGDIRIESDSYISSEKDSQIYYDAPGASFYIAHVNGANAVRVNDEPVISGSAKLKSYDILTIGKSKFIFVPLCGEQFKWEE